MNKAELERLRALAGNPQPTEAPEDRSRKNMYEIRDLMESAEQVEETEELDEEDQVDEADEELEEAKDEDLNEFDAEKYKAGADQIRKNIDADMKKRKERAEKEKKTEQQQMREWSNSVYQQYDDRGHHMEQPSGETVDLSLRRYLDAEAMPVKIEEDIDPRTLAKAYADFKGK